MIVTNQMARGTMVHALPNPVPLRIPDARADELRTRLIKRGLKEDQWFAVFHYRESTYQHRERYGERDSPPSVFDSLVDSIIALGGQAVRIGHPGMAPFRPRAGFVDLSLVEDDAFILHAAAVSHARFMIAGPSGPTTLAMGFCIPNTLVDAVDTGFIWGLDYTDVLTHEVTTPCGEALRNATLLNSGLLDSISLLERMKQEEGYKVRKADPGELAIVAKRLFDRSTDCRAWRAPAKPYDGPRSNQVPWPLRPSHPMPWLALQNSQSEQNRHEVGSKDQIASHLVNEMNPFHRIRRALPSAIARATDGGALHPLWDVIGDAQRILDADARACDKAQMERISEELEAGWIEPTAVAE
jgi:putative glycosyltransferase (TIGR04372 family)